MLLRPEYFTPGDLFRHEGIYHSFTHHSRFLRSLGRRMPRPYKQPLIRILRFPAKSDPVGNRVGNRFGLPPQEQRANADRSNCHKLPEKMFDRQRLSTQEIVGMETSATSPLGTKPRLENLIYRKSNPPLERRGAREPTQQSHPIASHGRLTERLSRPNRLLPAYEILMDELRDIPFLCGRYAPSLPIGH